MNDKIKSGLTMAISAVICVLGQISGKGGVNETAIQVTNANDYFGMKPTWVADEILVQGDENTNGWSFVLRISNTPWLSDQTPPVCSASIENISTNVSQCWVGFYGERYSKIELLDSNGEPVEKTAKGRQIATQADNAQIREMVKRRYQEWVNGRARTPGFVPVRPGQSVGVGFALADLFELKQPGEYELQVKTCLIQRIGGDGYDPDLKITWLPQVTTRIQIRSNETPQKMLPGSTQKGVKKVSVPNGS